MQRTMTCFRVAVRRPRISLSLMLVLAVVAGCRQRQPAAATPSPTPAPAVTTRPAAEVQAEVEALLARADALDGTTDHVVSKCAMCALYMKGKPEFTQEFSGYTMWLCSQHCLDAFRADPTKSVLTMEFPED